MFTSIKDFKKCWAYEREATEKIFSALTEEFLDKKFSEGQWTIGETAWHIVGVIPKMMNRTGLSMEMVCEYKSLKKKVSEILDAYHKCSDELIKEMEEKWTDDMLYEEDEMFGKMWKKGETLWVIIVHQIHHRGQMTVLMRQAGIQVPGVYGPSKEEWQARYGMESPAV